MSETPKSRPSSSRKGKVRKEFWLDPESLRQAQTLLGAETEREAVEMALDLVTFRHEVGHGLESLAGLELDPRD